MKATKVLNAEETLISKIILNVRDGQYIDSLKRVSPKADSEWVEKIQVNGNVWICKYETEKVSRYVLTVKDKDFTGKYVRRLVKAAEMALTGRASSPGGKKKEIKTEDELAGCWDLI